MTKKYLIGLIGILLMFVTGCSSGDSSEENSEDSTTSTKNDMVLQSDYDTVIVGGGVAGLTAGYFLKDEDILLIEKEDKVGGRTISGVYKSFTYPKGSEYIGKPEGALKRMITELNLEPKEIPYPMDGMYKDGEFYYGSMNIDLYLAEQAGFEEFKGFVEKLFYISQDYDEIPYTEYSSEFKRLDNMSATEWFEENAIRDILWEKYNVTSKGLFGANLNEISALSFIPEAIFDFDEEFLQIIRNSDSIEEFEKYLEDNDLLGEDTTGAYSFSTGLTELTDAIGEVLKDKLMLNSKVTNITKIDDIYEITYVNEQGEEERVTSENVILAVRAPEALRIASDVIDEDRKSLMDHVNYASFATVALYSDEPIFDQAFDLAVPNDFYFTDVYDGTWMDRYYNNKQDIEEYIASVYVGPNTNKDHKLNFIEDEELLNNIYKNLDKIFPNASSKVTGYDIQRFPFAYPIMTEGAYERLLELNELNEGTLILAGDYMQYPTFEAAIETGFLASEIIKEN